MFVRPTCCWKLDWDELESNQQDFNSLCKVLNEKVGSIVQPTQTIPNTITNYHNIERSMSDADLPVG